MTYSKDTLERLASELEAADKEMTPGPWGVLPEQFDPWHVNAPSRDVRALPYRHRPDEREADAHSICHLRNSAPEVAAALRAAAAEVERLRALVVEASLPFGLRRLYEHVFNDAGVSEADETRIIADIRERLAREQSK